jgi:hypothetical protein
MAHFAKLDENNIVVDIVVIHNSCLLDENEEESEQLGIDFCEQTYGGRWVQTSYNSNFRVRFAGIGFRYDEELDAFIPPCAYPSWTLNGVNWEPPVQKPSTIPADWTFTGDPYWWDEENLQWAVRTQPTEEGGQ